MSGLVCENPGYINDDSLATHSRIPSAVFHDNGTIERRWTVDLGESYQLDNLHLLAVNHAYTATETAYSVDGTNWSSITGWTLDGSGEETHTWRTLTFATPIVARYWRIGWRHASGGYAWESTEIDIKTLEVIGTDLPLDVAIGLDVYRIVPPGNSVVYIATLLDAFDTGIRPVRNAPGSGQFSINRHSAYATADILAPGNLVRVTIPEIDSTAPIFAYFMESGDFKLVSTDEEGGETITIGGRGALSYWDHAIWLSSKYTIPWWPGTMATPPAGTRGAVQVVAGTYRRYTIAGGVITGYANFKTAAGFSAYYDTTKTYLWPSANSKRFLAHLTTTEDPASPDYTGYYFHPHQDGVTDTHASYVTGTTSTVLLSDLSPDKPGVVLYRLFQEGTSVDRAVQPIPLMTIDFTDTLDSDGNAWATTDALAGLTAELGETYLTTIEKLVSTGAIDVEMGPDLIMHAYNAQGRDLSGTTFGAGKVRFVKGANIADELRRERHDNPVATFIEVVGTNGVTATASLTDAATRVARETSGTGGSADTTVLSALGLAALNARLVSSSAIGFRIAVGDDDAAGLYLPGPDWTEHGDFWLGDVVTLHTGTGEMNFDQADERVYAITIASDDAANLEVTPEVGSVLGAAEKALYGGTTTSVTSFTTRSPTTDTSVAEGGLSLPWFNVEDYGAVHDGATDDTAAIQAASDAAETAGGGVVFFPLGIYAISGALQDTGRSNAQLLLPRRKTDTIIEQITVEWRGEVAPPAIPSVGVWPPSGGTVALPDNGPVLESTLASGTGAVIGAWGPTGSFEDFSLVRVLLTNLTVRTVTNPTNSAVDLSHINAVEVVNVAIDTGSYDVPGHSTQTTATSYGLKLPGLNNGASTRVVNVNVVGFYNGFLVGEHTIIDNSAAWAAQRGYVFPFSYHTTQANRIGAYHCKVALAFTGDNYFSIDQLNIERAASGTWTPTYDIDDASNYGHGHLAWHAVLAGTGVDHTFTVNGATDIYKVEIGDNPFGSASFATPAIVLGTAAAAGAASTAIRSDSTIVAFDATVPVTQAFGDAAAAGSAAVAARRDHRHGMPATPTGGGGGTILISDTPAGSPLVFADLLQNDAGTDLLYSDT